MSSLRIKLRQGQPMSIRALALQLGRPEAWLIAQCRSGRIAGSYVHQATRKWWVGLPAVVQL